MTICISAIGGDEKSGEEFIVFGTDHMVTFGNDSLSNEFEHNIKKYKELGINKLVVAMLSGKTLLFEELLKGTDRLVDYDDIMNKIHNNFKTIKKSEIQTQLLEPFSLSEKDLKEFLLRPIENPVAKVILEGILKHNLNMGILLIGFKDNQAQIFEISENQITSSRDIHFHSIGSGSLQASNSLFIQKHSREKNLKQTIYNVYKAKRNAEIAQGVGIETDILICSKDKIIELDKKDLEKLKKIYENELSFGETEIVQESLNSISGLLNSVEEVEKNG